MCGKCNEELRLVAECSCRRRPAVVADAALPDLAELERIARAATPGPWRWGDWSATFGTPEHAEHMLVLERNASHQGAEPYVVGRRDGRLEVLRLEEPPDRRANAAHIAANSPDVTLALVARIRDLDALYTAVAKAIEALERDADLARQRMANLDRRLAQMRAGISELHATLDARTDPCGGYAQDLRDILELDDMLGRGDQKAQPSSQVLPTLSEAQVLASVGTGERFSGEDLSTIFGDGDPAPADVCEVCGAGSSQPCAPGCSEHPSNTAAPPAAVVGQHRRADHITLTFRGSIAEAPFVCPRGIHALVCDCTGERRLVGPSR
jgi:hypothetical protein